MERGLAAKARWNCRPGTLHRYRRVDERDRGLADPETTRRSGNRDPLRRSLPEGALPAKLLDPGFPFGTGRVLRKPCSSGDREIPLGIAEEGAGALPRGGGGRGPRHDGCPGRAPIVLLGLGQGFRPVEGKRLLAEDVNLAERRMMLRGKARSPPSSFGARSTRCFRRSFSATGGTARGSSNDSGGPPASPLEGREPGEARGPACLPRAPLRRQ